MMSAIVRRARAAGNLGRAAMAGVGRSCDNPRMVKPFSLSLVLLMTCALAPALAGQDVAPQDPLQLVVEGRKLMASGKLDESAAKYERALALDAKLFEAHLSLGIVLDLKAQYAEARKHLEQALALSKEDSDNTDTALGALAVSYVFTHDAAGAARYYQQLYDRRVAAGRLDASAETANALARVYLEMGDTANARRWYETSRQNVQKLSGLTTDVIDLWEMRWHHALSRLAARNGDKATATREADAVKALIDKGGVNAQQRPIYDYLLGYDAFYFGDYDAALAALQNADQKDPFILGLIAQAYEKKGDAASAKAAWVKVLASPAHSIQNAVMRPLAMKALATKAA
jgi:tetratricopeptide (TPR) repeat protein